jgi:hypothetical protein
MNMTTKPKPLFAIIALAVVCAFAPAVAQPSPAAAPPNAMGTPPRKLEVFDSSFPFRIAIEQALQGELAKRGLPPVNVVFGPGTSDLVISNLVLRNVNGPDAVQLMAAAAGCTVEPITSNEEVSVSANGGMRPMIVGYKVNVLPNHLRQSPMQPAVSPVTAVGGDRAQAKPRTTRVYALGTITSYTKFNELEKALQDILKVDSVPQNQVSLALHEKVNVLVVNAPDSVHLLIEQFLGALGRNSQEADQQNATREVGRMRAELEISEQTKALLRRELDQREEQIGDLQKELRKLQDPSRKKTGEP